MTHFSVVKQDPGCAARAGLFKTAHGSVRTPAFMPLATKGTVKSVSVVELDEIGSDIAMLLDDCPPSDAKPPELKGAVEQTVRWARRGLEYGRKIGVPQIFVITQGGTDGDLRKWCAQQLAELRPDGFGIGGLS